jgi:Protein of unknown function (DUF4058)
MPIHDRSQVAAGLFHHFHQCWTVAICEALNAGRLPQGYSALIEQSGAGIHPDGVTHDRSASSDRASDEAGYAAKANRIAIHHRLGNVIADIEVLSPGNKNSRHAIRAFVEKTLDFLHQGVNLLIIDLFPPSRRDPQGIHKVIWDEIREEPFELPSDKQFTLVTYTAGTMKRAYVEPIAVGEPLPVMPLLLDSDTDILAPLEAAYLAAWETCPEEFREAV